MYKSKIEDGVGILTLTRFDETMMHQALHKDFKDKRRAGGSAGPCGNGGGFTCRLPASGWYGWIKRQL